MSIFPISLPLFIGHRIKYKLACVCYNCMSTNSPPYLSDLLTVYTAARQLRSSSDYSVIRRPSVRTVYFAYSAPSAWNSLPQQVRSSDNVSTFRSRTKTHLFQIACNKYPVLLLILLLSHRSNSGTSMWNCSIKQLRLNNLKLVYSVLATPQFRFASRLYGRTPSGLGP